MKSFDELTIQDDFMFYKVMQNQNICKKILQTILGKKIGKIIKLSQQNILDNSYGAKGVRLDVLAKDDGERFYNIEMQMTDDPSLSYRLRYYQGSLDVTVLGKGQDYDELPKTIIIFLCNGDMLGNGLPISTIHKRCDEDGKIINDGTKDIIVNYSLYELIENNELKHLCKYCKTKDVKSELVKEIDMEVNAVKQNEKARQEYSFLFNRYPDHILKEIKKAKKEGEEKGILQGILQGRAEGIKQANMEMTHLTKEEIEQM